MKTLAFLLLVLALPQDEPIKRAVVVLATEGHYNFNGEDIKRADIPRRIWEALDQAPAAEQIIYITVGEDVSYATVRDFLVITRERGFDHVSLSIRRGSGDEKLLPTYIYAPEHAKRTASSGIEWSRPDPKPEAGPAPPTPKAPPPKGVAPA